MMIILSFLFLGFIKIFDREFLKIFIEYLILILFNEYFIKRLQFILKFIILPFLFYLEFKIMIHYQDHFNLESFLI
jgi:hypothetical protein